MLYCAKHFLKEIRKTLTLVYLSVLKLSWFLSWYLPNQVESYTVRLFQTMKVLCFTLLTREGQLPGHSVVQLSVVYQCRSTALFLYLRGNYIKWFLPDSFLYQEHETSACNSIWIGMLFNSDVIFIRSLCLPQNVAIANKPSFEWVNVSFICFILVNTMNSA